MKRWFNILLVVVVMSPAFLGCGKKEVVQDATPYMYMQDSEAMTSKVPRLYARFSSDSVVVGDLFYLEIEVAKDLMQVVGLPEFEDSLIGEHIEIVWQSGLDTLYREGRRVVLGQRYRVMTFEEGIFQFDRLAAMYGDKNVLDTIWSVDSLNLTVSLVDIDTTISTIYDIKGLKKAPLKFGEIWLYVLLALVLIVVIAIVWWVVYTRRKQLTLLGRPKVILPPHVTAIKALEELHNQKVWQMGDYKRYYTTITEIMRIYIKDRFGVLAPKLTSESIIEALSTLELSEKNFKEIKEMLQLADLVKFAKVEPDASSNENAYLSAYYFVESTKIEEQQEVKEDEE